MRPADRRRTRRILLLLAATLIPTAVVAVLVVRVVRQENELAAQRAAAERRETLDQLRRELAARLQALRLGEVNRMIGEPGRRLPDSPIVFVSPMVQDRMVPPWEDGDAAAAPSPDFFLRQQAGEALEFVRGDASAAAAAYRDALTGAKTRADACFARLALGRASSKAGLRREAEASDRLMLDECGAIADSDGVPVALYAAERLAAIGDPAAADYAIRSVAMRQWHPPSEAYALQSLLRRFPADRVAEPLRRLAAEIHDVEQIDAFARKASTHLERLRRVSRSGPGDLAWVGYGDEPWLLTLVSPTSFAQPVVMAVSARRIAPAGVSIEAAPTAGSVPLGDGFIDVYARWPPGRFAASPAVPTAIPAVVLVVVLGAALGTACLLLRDVHREANIAEMRAQFVASVSHELKTPLTSIRAHAETLLMGRADGPTATSEYLRTIVGESERLARLVDGVLEFSRIEEGRKTYHMQVVRLEDVVRRAASALEHPLAQLNFTLTVASDGSAPAVRGDPDALTQAVLNLLGNAMKYSGMDRRIELCVGTRGEAAFVDVVDHGIGIEPHEQARIFERFHRVQSAETSGIAGAGLGLALALHVVEAHRGRIEVVSSLGHGTTFSVLIPAQEQT